VNPNRGPYMIGWMGCLVAFLVTAGAGAWYLVGIPSPDEAKQRSEARITVLAVGVGIGLTTMAVGAYVFFALSDTAVPGLETVDRGLPGEPQPRPAVHHLRHPAGVGHPPGERHPRPARPVRGRQPRPAQDAVHQRRRQHRGTERTAGTLPAGRAERHRPARDR